MALVKILARHLNPEINTGTTASPTWVPVKGINNLTIANEKSDVDDTDFDSDGWAEHKAVQRTAKITCEGHYMEDPATGARDPGQEALITLGDAVGYDSIKGFRLTTPGGNTVIYQVSAKVDAPSGGGHNDNASFKAELTVSGKPEFTAAP